MCEKILNIAGGKIPPLNPKDPAFIVNIDTMFYRNHDPADVEQQGLTWNQSHNVMYDVRSDAFEFMERTVLSFDRVCIYRFLEHVSFTQLPYFIYLVSTVTKVGDNVDVIVPNYEILANMILEEAQFFEENNMAVFPEHNILLTTELLNEPSCPHASIWTPARAKYFWELEGRFNVTIDSTAFEFDGRDLYLRFFATRTRT